MPSESIAQALPRWVSADNGRDIGSIFSQIFLKDFSDPFDFLLGAKGHLQILTS